MDLFYFIRIFLGTLMIATAVLKLLSFHSFTLTIRQLNTVIINPAFTIACVISLEMLSGIFMFIPALYLGGLLFIVLLSISFIWVSIRSKKLPGKITCNCFGSLIPETLGDHTIHRAIFLIALALFTGIIEFAFGGKAVSQAAVYPIALGILQSIAIISLYGHLRILLARPEPE